MKAQTFIAVAVLVALSASMVSGQHSFNFYLDRDEFTATGYFVDVIVSFGSYVDSFLPIGTKFGPEYPAGAENSGNYRSNDFSGNSNYFYSQSFPVPNAFISSFTETATDDFLVGGIGSGYIFSEGEGIGLTFEEQVNAVGFFLEAAGNVVGGMAYMYASNDGGNYLTYSTYAYSHTQFWGVTDDPVGSIGFRWDNRNFGSVATRGTIGTPYPLAADFYEDKAELVMSDPYLAGIKHVLLPAAYVGNLFAARDVIASETIVNVVDDRTMSLNMILAPVQGEAVFTTAAFTLASGAQVLVEAGADDVFAVSVDGADLTEGSVVAGADFKVMYDQFANMPRTAIAGGQSWFEQNFSGETHNSIVRVATSDVVVDVSLSTKDDGSALLNVNMRELQQTASASGMLKANDRMAKKATRSVDAFEQLVAAHVVDSLF